ncbi:hypothetical protein K9N50_08710, partial [bacterium]|nr:hypothetical protein [bacterium]
ISGGINATLADGGYNPAREDTFMVVGYKKDFVPLELSLGVDLKPRENHSVGLSFYKVNHTENGSITMWQWIGATNKWQARTTMNTDQATYVKQNDFAVKLRYTYTF